MPKPLTVCITTNWKILKEMGVPDHLTCLLINLYAGQKATVTGHGTMDWFQIGKGVRQGCLLSPCLFNLYVEYIMRNVSLDEAQAGIKISGRNINNLRYADDTTLITLCRKQRGTKEPLDKGKRGEWKSWLKTQHSKNKDHGICSHYFMAIDGKTMETVTDFIFWVPKSLWTVTAAMKLKDTCSLEVKLWQT